MRKLRSLLIQSEGITHQLQSLWGRTCFRCWCQACVRWEVVAALIWRPYAPYPLSSWERNETVGVFPLHAVFGEPVGIELVRVLPHLGIPMNGVHRNGNHGLWGIFALRTLFRSPISLALAFNRIPSISMSSTTCRRSKGAGGYSRRARQAYYYTPSWKHIIRTLLDHHQHELHLKSSKALVGITHLTPD